MRNFIIVIIFVFFTGLDIVNAQDDPIVYICGTSKIFHNVLSHNALEFQCKSEIWTMKKSEAIKSGKRQCRCKY
ncbi:hypothetical protein HNQ88_002975 [Aureibacter tunicatorum]|uniref:Uncharacterized protein n=1 Tax=Aureibacter tunicatorum TaxID=866807 RepID=A0AAE3XMZ2_9BACT|nr:hypothetical protein [Aureibacter tunicatorum]BDD04402.1 hypothetical protein AUTU_18850 [Aureibacter tunicatorum]